MYLSNVIFYAAYAAYNSTYRISASSLLELVLFWLDRPYARFALSYCTYMKELINDLFLKVYMYQDNHGIGKTYLYFSNSLYIQGLKD